MENDTRQKRQKSLMIFLIVGTSAAVLPMTFSGNATGSEGCGGNEADPVESSTAALLTSIANGQTCTNPNWGHSTECVSGYCVKGPPRSPCDGQPARFYCMAANKTCPEPGTDGVATGVTYRAFSDRYYTCAPISGLGLADGATCNDSTDPGGLPCASGRCLGGPRGDRYCAATGFDCPSPYTPYGINHGETINLDGGRWDCDGQNLVPHCSVPGCAGVGNGFLCHSDGDCSSNKCRLGPGPDQQHYCVAADKDCARPRFEYTTLPHDGVNWGTSYEYLGRTWQCSSHLGRLLDRGPLDHHGYGAQTWKFSTPIGGGPGYSSFVSSKAKGFISVSSAVGLYKAVAQANLNGGGVVFIKGTVEINLSDIADHLPMVLQKGVTVASDRGRKGSPGALLYLDPDPSHPGTQKFWAPSHQKFVFTLQGDNTRITGLRLRGTDPHTRFASNCHPYENAIAVNGANARIDNCELAQWNYRAIHLSNAGTRVMIAHNYIHHSRRYGRGYGVTVSGAALSGTAKIRANIFDFGRHAIAGSGTSETRYHADYNIVGGAFTHHRFDMHDGGMNPGLGGIPGVGGTKVTILRNSFYGYSPLGMFRIGGVSEETSIVRRNHFDGTYRLEASAAPQTECPHPYDHTRYSATLIDPGGSCAVAQVIAGATRFSLFQDLQVYDNRHANDPTSCTVSSCTYSWSCGDGQCVNGSCVCPSP